MRLISPPFVLIPLWGLSRNVKKRKYKITLLICFLCSYLKDFKAKDF